MDASSPSVTPSPDPPPQPLHHLVPEAVLAFFLLLLLVWFLNREFEVSYRLHYHGNEEADKHRSNIQTMRDQAEWLLGNIIPIHVADQLKVLCCFLDYDWGSHNVGSLTLCLQTLSFSHWTVQKFGRKLKVPYFT